MELPALDFERFCRRLGRTAPERLSSQTQRALWAHYEQLREWSRVLSLVGPGTAAEVVERHYGESLAALPWVGDGPRVLVDVGSGAGFPGLVLAAARPRLKAWLVESRQRKWAFLRAAAARAGLSCHCLNARVAAALPPDLPEKLDLVTLRAVKLPPSVLGALLERLRPAGALLWWHGGERPGLPAGWQVARETPLAGSERRRILEVRRAR